MAQFQRALSLLNILRFRDKLNVSDLRYRRAAWTSLLVVASRLVGILTAFITIPLLARHLGIELFGLWMLATNFVGFLVFADLGVGVGFQNQLIRCFAAKDESKPGVWMANALAVVSCMAAALLTVAIFIVPYLPLHKLLSHASPTAQQWVIPAAQSLIASFAIGLPAMLVEYIGNAYQRGYWTHGLSALGRILSFVLICCGCYFNASLPLLIFFFVGVPHIVSLTGLAFTWRRVPWLRPKFHSISWQPIKQLVQVGVGMLGVRITHAISMQAPSLLTAQLHGLEAAGLIAVMQKILTIPAMLTQPMLIATQGAMGEASHTQDWQWLRRHMTRLAVLTSIVFIASSAILVAVGGSGLTLLLDSNHAPPTRLLIASLCLYTGISSVRSIFGAFLTVIDRVFFQTAYRLIAITSALFAVLLYHPSTEAIILVFACVAELPQLLCSAFEANHIVCQGERNFSPQAKYGIASTNAKCL